jgi:hypothetical protein
MRRKRENTLTINKGRKTGRRRMRRYTTGEWVVVERNGIMLHRRVWGTVNAGKKSAKMVLQ